MIGNIVPVIWSYVDIYTVGIPIAVFCLTHFFIWKGFFSNKGNRPYGIYGVPLGGTVPYFAFSKLGVFEKMQYYAKKYGPVLRIRVGNGDAIVINGTKAVREGMLNDDLLGRPPNLGGDDSESFFTLPSVINLENDLWKKHRRFSLITLRDLGFGKTAIMEDRVQEEIREVSQLLEEKKGEPLDINEILLSSTLNNISTLIYGERLPYDSEKRKEIYDVLNGFNRENEKFLSIAFIPLVARIMQKFKLGVVGRMSGYMKRFFNFQNQAIEVHRNELDRENPKDYMDHYLMEKEKDKDFTDKLLSGNSMILFLAGSGTVRVTVEYLLQLMAHLPEVQKKVQKEIDDITGGSREVTWADSAQMVYTMAVIAERHRYFPVTPSGVPRRALRDTKVAGYDILAHEMVVFNIDSVHFDESQFPNPYDFRPERFIDENGKLVNTEKVWAFSIGKRACPGESLAVLEVFLYFAIILQNFNIVSDETVKFRPMRHFVAETLRQKIRFVKRE